MQKKISFFANSLNMPETERNFLNLTKGTQKKEKARTVFNSGDQKQDKDFFNISISHQAGLTRNYNESRTQNKKSYLFKMKEHICTHQ